MASLCPFSGGGGKSEAPKCPLGYDAASFKLGPFSCLVCRALLFDAARCLPCRHVFCRACISRFKDCPLCGADIDGFQDDPGLQQLVDQFIQGHGRMSRPDELDGAQVMYEDASLARGSFLLQHAMRAYQAQNLASAKARLHLCLEDTKNMLARSGAAEESRMCSQLGAVLGLLGDCLRSMGDMEGASSKYKESVEALQRIASRDPEVVHALSVSLNKLGDLKYIAQDLPSALDLYKSALELRQSVLVQDTSLSAEVLDVAVSLAKVADMELALGHAASAAEGFTAAIRKLEGLSCSGADPMQLERRRLSVLEFLYQQQGQ